MSGGDGQTLAFYAAEAQAYANRPRPVDRARLDAFLALLPAGGSILELGCGGGQDSEAMLAKGFDVTPTDGSPELAREAGRRLGMPVRTLLFGDLRETNRYHGVWARACLLHVPRIELPAVIARVHAALRAGGVFYASFKSGRPEGRDKFRRYYNNPSADWLGEVYAGSVWALIDIQRTAGGGYDGAATDWLHLVARKPG
jgi:SAM-dependent methyltransferase